MFLASSLYVAPASGFQVIPGARNPIRMPTTSLNYIPSAAEDVPDSTKTPNFDQSVRSLIEKTSKQSLADIAKTSSTPKTPSKKGLPNLFEVNSKQEFRRRFLEEADDQVTMIRVYSPVCKACKAVERDFELLAKANPNVNFINIAYNKDKTNRDLVHAMGIPSFPYTQLYRGKELIEEGSLNKKYFKGWKASLESHMYGGVELPVDDNGEIDVSNPNPNPTRKIWAGY